MASLSMELFFSLDSRNGTGWVGSLATGCNWVLVLSSSSEGSRQHLLNGAWLGGG